MSLALRSPRLANGKKLKFAWYLIHLLRYNQVSFWDYVPRRWRDVIRIYCHRQDPGTLHWGKYQCDFEIEYRVRTRELYCVPPSSIERGWLVSTWRYSTHRMLREHRRISNRHSTSSAYHHWKRVQCFPSSIPEDRLPVSVSREYAILPLDRSQHLAGCFRPLGHTVFSKSPSTEYSTMESLSTSILVSYRYV